MHQEIAKRVIKDLARKRNSKFIKGIVWTGTSAWDQNLNKKSDIDLEIFIDNLHYSTFYSSLKIKRDLDVFISHTNKYNLDYISSKINIDTIKVSLHFIPLEKLHFPSPNKLFNNRDRISVYRELRLQSKDKQPIYNQRNFSGEFIRYKIPVIKTEIGYISKTPITIVQKDRMHLGILQDKLLSGKLVYASSRFNSLYQSYIERIFKRCKYEESLGFGCDIGKCMHNYQKMPQSRLNRIRQKYENYKFRTR